MERGSIPVETTVTATRWSVGSRLRRGLGLGGGCTLTTPKAGAAGTAYDVTSTTAAGNVSRTQVI